MIWLVNHPIQGVNDEYGNHRVFALYTSRKIWGGAELPWKDLSTTKVAGHVT